MTFYEDIYAGLTGHAGLNAEISNRLYPLEWPQSPTFPLVTYQPISAPSEQAINRTIAGWRERLQFDVWAESFDSGVAVRTQLVAALIALPEGDVALYEVGITQQGPVVKEPDTGLYRSICEAVMVHG